MKPDHNLIQYVILCGAPHATMQIAQIRFRECYGWMGRDERLAVVSELFDRNITSFKDLEEYELDALTEACKLCTTPVEQEAS